MRLVLKYSPRFTENVESSLHYVPPSAGRFEDYSANCALSDLEVFGGSLRRFRLPVQL